MNSWSGGSPNWYRWGRSRPTSSCRACAASRGTLGVNPNTVQKAYQELERSGVIYSVAGKGSFVSPGPAAARMLRGQRLEKLREAAAEGRRAGIPREEALGAVKAVYEEGTNHD